MTLSCAVLWWLVLGIPLAWDKGMLSDASAPHTWIGVDFKVIAPGTARMELPSSFLEELLALLAPFCSERGHAPLADARRLVGKVARVASVETPRRVKSDGFLI